MPNYTAYGLTIASDMALPALRPCDAATADITMAEGLIPEGAGGPVKFRNWEAGPDEILTVYYDVCRVWIHSGDTIIYERMEGVDDTQIVSVLLGTSLAAALMQRRMLPIHSCAVLTDKGVVMVMGPSGAGKSTTLGGLLEFGLPMLADDVTGIRLDDSGHPIAIPAFPAIRLWEDSLTSLGHTSDGLPQVRSDMAKYYLGAENFHDQPEPVRAMIYLNPSLDEDLHISEVKPELRVPTLSRFIFRKNFLDGMGARRFAFETVAGMVDRITMLEVRRPKSGMQPALLAKEALQFLAETEAKATQVDAS